MEPETVDAAEIDAEIESMRRREAELTPVNRPTGPNDAVRITARGTVAGEADEGLRLTNYLIFIGDDIIPGLTRKLVPRRPGDQFSLRTKVLMGPNAGKQARIEIEVKQVYQASPASDERLLDKYHCGSMDELRARVENIIEGRRAAAIRDQLRAARANGD